MILCETQQQSFFLVGKPFTHPHTHAHAHARRKDEHVARDRALALLVSHTTYYRDRDVTTSTRLCRQAQSCFLFVDRERLADATADVEAAVRTNEKKQGAANSPALPSSNIARIAVETRPSQVKTIRTPKPFPSFFCVLYWRFQRCSRAHRSCFGNFPPDATTDGDNKNKTKYRVPRRAPPISTICTKCGRD